MEAVGSQPPSKGGEGGVGSVGGVGGVVGVWGVGGAAGVGRVYRRGDGVEEGGRKDGGLTTTEPYGRRFARGSDTTTDRDQSASKRQCTTQLDSSSAAGPLIKEGSGLAISHTDVAMSSGGVGGFGRTEVSAALIREHDGDFGAGKSRTGAAGFGGQVFHPRGVV